MKVRNGILRGELKVKGGKYIKCIIKIGEGKIKKIKFTGDFFMYPEEKIEEIEKKLEGVVLNEKEIGRILDEFFENVEIIGATKEDFLRVIMESNDNH